MDRLIYVAMTGASHIMVQQAAVTQNLANVNTTGYKAQQDSFRALPVMGDGTPTRVFAVNSTVGSDFNPGVIQTTGRDLDVSVQGKGWIAVQGTDGREAYTRSGSLEINVNGLLQTRDGLNVLGDGGPISIPPDSALTIAKDGTVSSVSTSEPGGSVVVLGRIKLVNPDDKGLIRGDDGLFRMSSGGPAPADENVQVASGTLESSNGNTSESMVNMINLSRQFDMQMKLLQNAENNASKATQLLTVSG